MASKYLSVVFALLFGSLSLLSATISKAGTTVVYKDQDTPVFQIEVPDFWSLRTGGLRELADPEKGDLRDISRVFGLSPDAHDGIWVGMISPHGVTTLDQAREYLQEIGPFLVQDVTVEDPVRRKIAGLPARTIAGQGKRNGKTVNFTAVSIDLPGARVAIAVVVLEAGADTEPVGDINAMLGSIRAAR